MEQLTRVIKRNNFSFDGLKSTKGLADCKFITMDLAGLTTERQKCSINIFPFFMMYFNRIPNFTHETDINCEKANEWFADSYKSEINDWYYTKRYYNGNTAAKLDEIIYLLDKDLLVNFDFSVGIVRLFFRETGNDLVDEVITGLKKFKKRKNKYHPEILLLVNNRGSIQTIPLKITKPKLSLTDNYNDDFKEIHAIILKKLSRKNDKGMVLLHGRPGTGKTSYIRYLVSLLRKHVIFLPPNMADAITTPDLISVLLENRNSVLVIEDAEHIVVDREKDGNSPVSALLNISDGLLSDCLNVQIICSFNTDLSKVDSALTRKGRLIAKYEFKELEVPKARQLSEKLGFSTHINEPMTLTAIYNQDEKDFQQAKRNNSIGFKI